MEQLKFSDYKPKLNMNLYHNWQRRFLRYLKWMKVKVSGLEKISKVEAAILAPNHISWMDIPLLGALIRRPISFIATFQLFDKNLCHKLLDSYLGKVTNSPALKDAIHRFNYFLSKFLVEHVTRLGSIPAKMEINNFSLTKTTKTLLHQNKLLCIFPEGTLGSPGNLRRFKLGTAKVLYDYYLEFRKSIPVFPIGIIGTKDICYPGMKMGLHVGEPLYIEDYLESDEKRTLVNFINELRNAVDKLIIQG